MSDTPHKPKKNFFVRLLQNRRVLFCLWAVAVLAVSASFAVQRIAVLDFNPINGDFQSYNIFRRMLAGQAPYADFANYVGMAPVLVNLPFLLLNGSFAASLFATNFTCNVLFSLLVLVVFCLATKNGPVSLLVSAVFSKLVSSGLVGTLFGPRWGGYFTGLFQNLYTPSNSMRMARLFWPFLLVLAFLVFDHLWQRRRGSAYPLYAAHRRPGFCTVLGTLAGLGLVWSNDFGLAVIFTTAVLLVLLLIFQKPKAGRFAGHLYGAGLLAGAFVGVFASTQGHPTAFVGFTASVAQYQYFYFNGTGGRALLPYIFTNARLLLYTLPYTAFLVFCLVRLIQNKLDSRLLLAGFLAFTVLVASYAYIVSGSGYNFTEALEGCFWLAAFALLARLVLWLLRRFGGAIRLFAAALLGACALLFCGLALRDVLARPAPPPQAVYVQALGGYAPYPLALVQAPALVGTETVFSLYATGLEVVTEQFQPSGFDYVIHALGADNQHQYLASFLTGQYPFVQTTALGVEGWLAVENWYVYRYIARNYVRVMETEYSWIWRRAGDQRLTVTTEISMARQGGLWEITVTAPPGASFVADVRLEYDVSFSSLGGAALSLGRSAAALTVADPMAPEQDVGCYLPARGRDVTIPITVQNGVGRALLAPADAGVSTLALHAATVENTLPFLGLPL